MNTSTPNPPRRRNPWPIVIIAYFIVFAGFIVAFTVFASRQRNDLVQTDYYEAEIKFQQQLDRMNRSQAASAQIEIAYDAPRQAVTLTLSPSQLNHPTGTIRFYRPSDARMDQQFPLAVGADGSQSLDARKLPAGLWKVRVQWSVDGRDFFCDKPVVVGAPRA